MTTSLFPLSSEILFRFESHNLSKLPGFFFQEIISATNPNAEAEEEFFSLSGWPMDLPEDQNNPQIKKILTYLQTHVTWSKIEPYINLAPDSCEYLSAMWQQKKQQQDKYRIEIRRTSLPPKLYFYTESRDDRMLELFKNNKVYLRSPYQFNDPFDCSNDEQTRLACIEWGMWCFSKVKDNVLMFSHYADHHRGLCIGVDPLKLVSAMCDSTCDFHVDIRPIWYFKKMPPLDFAKAPALCVTCKHDIWSYEQEYRLFLVRQGKVLPFGLYSLLPDAFTSIIFGCRASDKIVSFIKSITSHLHTLKYLKAEKVSNRYGVNLLEIKKL